MPQDSTDSQRKSRRRGLSRRNLFAAAGVTGAAALAIRPSTTAPTSSKPSRSHARYRETEHVRTVYRLARF